MISVKMKRKEKSKIQLNYKNSISNRSSRVYHEIFQPEWNAISPIGQGSDKSVVTGIRQLHELEAVIDCQGADAHNQTSSQWLAYHDVHAKKLTIDAFFRNAALVNTDETGNGDAIRKHQVYKVAASVYDDYEIRLKKHLHMLQERIGWLREGSREAFGVIYGSKPCVLFDCSDINLSTSRLPCFQHFIKLLIEEQLRKKCQVFVVPFGTHATPLWDTPKSLNDSLIEDILEWNSNLVSSGGCNVLEALRHAFQHPDVDEVVLVVGGSPDQKPEVIMDYVVESLSGKQVGLHCVGFCAAANTNIMIEELALVSHGRYHHYSPTHRAASTDINLINQELEKVNSILRDLEKLGQGSIINCKALMLLDNTEKEMALKTLTVAHNSDNTSLSQEIRVHPPSVPMQSSAEWITKHGLKAKGLTLYQVMAPNAFSYVKSYVSSINKVVQSQIYHKSMVQLEWHDGSTKNVHVDLAVLFNYQHLLDLALQLYRRRLEWLSSGSRKLLGTIVEDRVILLVDVSHSQPENINSLFDSCRRLLEEQLSGKKLFNLICFSTQAVSYRNQMVVPDTESLNLCWRFLRNQVAGPCRNLLEAFRMAVEMETVKTLHSELNGIYLFTSGIPDERKEIVCSYVMEALAGTDVRLHCVYLEPREGFVRYAAGTYASPERTADYLRDLAHCARGRFHWVKGTDVIESDDIRVIVEEMEKANNYLHKSQLLLDKIKERREVSTAKSSETQLVPRPPEVPKRSKSVCQIQNSPSHTRLSLDRPKSASPSQSSSSCNASSSRKAKCRPRSSRSCRPSSPAKAITWRPNFTKSNFLISSGPKPLPEKMFKDVSSACKDPASTPHIFYTEIGNSVGSIPQRISGVTPSPPVKRLGKAGFNIPDHEEFLSSKDWLHKYGLSRLRLNLHAIISSFECKHSTEDVPAIGKTVHARYCKIFPCVKIKGEARHIHLQSHELKEYEARLELVMKRYIKRMNWLQSGSRRVFGALTERAVVLLIDVSGSMVTFMDDLKREFAVLVADQLYKKNLTFNVVQFSSTCVCWKRDLVPATEDSCQDVIRWMKAAEPYGSTATLEALKMAFDMHCDVEGIYLLTDGKPDSSTASLLQEAANMNKERYVKIHTISFNCEDSTANQFLQALAAQSNGRYHRFRSDASDALSQEFTAECLEMPDLETRCFRSLEGDDIRRLAKEISRCRQFLMQSRSYRAFFDKQKDLLNEGLEQGTILEPTAPDLVVT